LCGAFAASELGVNPDKTLMPLARLYPKAQLLARDHLANEYLALNFLVRVVTIVQTLLDEVIRSIVLKFPQKVGSKRMIALKDVLESVSVAEMQTWSDRGRQPRWFKAALRKRKTHRSLLIQ
jgi:hypothetical protein